LASVTATRFFQFRIIILANLLCDSYINNIMRRTSLLFALLILFCTAGYGQTENIRRLQQQLPQITDSLTYVDVLNRLGMLSYEENVDSTLFYTDSARAIATRLRYPRGLADASNNLGIVYDMKGNLQLALRYYNDARIRYGTLNDSANVVQTVMNIAMVYQEMGKNEKAIQHYLEAATLGRQLRQDSILSLVYYNFVLQYPGSMPADSARLYLQRARQIGIKYADGRLLLAVDQLTAGNYIRANEREKGVALLKQTLAATLENKLHYLSLDILADLGNFYAPTDSAQALRYYRQGLDIAREKNYMIYTARFTRLLYNFYSTRNAASAFYYSKQLLALHDQQDKINGNSGIDYIEYALKDQQLESARTQSEYRLLFLFLALLLCIMTIVTIIILWRSRKRSRKTAEALRLQFEQSETTMDALDQMNKSYARVIKIVAHDLRNPIGAISAITEMIQPDQMLTGQTRELIDLVQVSSRNCLQLINELLETDFDQQQNLKREPLNINELLRQCVQLLSFRAKDKNQQLILTGNVPDATPGDQEKLWRVMNNLVMNAIKFSPAGSEINIDARVLDNEVVISVKDNGMGIPPQLQQKIFDPFTSARRQGTEGEQPFGLGLYISKQIIEAHGGRIWMESVEGGGTVFFVALPVKRA